MKHRIKRAEHPGENTRIHQTVLILANKYIGFMVFEAPARSRRSSHEAKFIRKISSRIHWGLGMGDSRGLLLKCTLFYQLEILEAMGAWKFSQSKSCQVFEFVFVGLVCLWSQQLPWTNPQEFSVFWPEAGERSLPPWFPFLIFPSRAVSWAWTNELWFQRQTSQQSRSGPACTELREPCSQGFHSCRSYCWAWTVEPPRDLLYEHTLSCLERCSLAWCLDG